MKSGVSTVPWGRVRVPARAEPEVASSVNSNTRYSTRNAEVGTRNKALVLVFRVPRSEFRVQMITIASP